MSTVSVFYLGSISDLDPDETNFVSENASDLSGLLFGSSTEPLYDSIDALTLVDLDGDGQVNANDYVDNAENLIYDGTTSQLDSIIEYNVTITYSDGSTVSTTMGLLQDVSGRAFLIPYEEGNANNEVLDDHPIVSIQIDSVSSDYFYTVYSNIEQDAFITCFVAGTMIATKQGLMDIAQLSVGDKVCTMDHGLQPIRWIGAQRVRATGQFAPVKIAVGALGQGLPTRELRLSPQHRILVRSKIAQRIFGVSEVLLPAKKMLGMLGITVALDVRYITYWHLLFDQHEIVFSEGAATESFYTGPEAMNALDSAAKAEILALFPELADNKSASPPARSPVRAPARPIARGKLQKQLLARHQKNDRLIYQDYVI